MTAAAASARRCAVSTAPGGSAAAAAAIAGWCGRGWARGGAKGRPGRAAAKGRPLLPAARGAVAAVGRSAAAIKRWRLTVRVRESAAGGGAMRGQNG